MSELIVSLAGTPAGQVLALSLALTSALAHAIFGAINKGGVDPWLNRGAINVFYGVMAAPVALFVLPWPSPAVWRVLAVSYVVHLAYEIFQAAAYQRGAFTVVYPIARGSGPFITALLALVVFGEVLAPGQWFGLAVLSAAILMLALANFRDLKGRHEPTGDLRIAVAAALATGVMVACYTTIDAYGVRQSDNPFTFIAWFFTLGGFGFPFVALRRWQRLSVRPPLRDLAVRGFFGALIAFVSFGGILLATRVGKVGQVAALRETSIVFATAIGVLIFRERIDLARIGLIMLIVAGAVLLEVS